MSGCGPDWGVLEKGLVGILAMMHAWAVCFCICTECWCHTGKSKQYKGKGMNCPVDRASRPQGRRPQRRKTGTRGTLLVFVALDALEM